MRTHQDMANYFKTVGSAVSGIETAVKDVHETVIGDVGLVTAWLEQDYTIEGQKRHVSAPTTVVFRREDGAWKITLFHSFPLSEQG